MDVAPTLPVSGFLLKTETLISNTECAIQRTYTDGSQIAEFMEKIYRIIDGKHDFEDSRSYLNATQCNNSILKEQLSGTVPIGDVAGYKIIKYICEPGTPDVVTPILGPTALTSGANTLHGFVDFETGLQKHPFVPGQYIKVEVKNGTAVYASYCVDRPFIGEYHIEESKLAGKSKSPASKSAGTSNTHVAGNLWKDELSQLIQDRQIYGKRAIYNIYFGNKDTFKEWLAQENNERIAELEKIFEFKKRYHTIDASKLNRIEILSKLYGDYSVTGAGDAVDPSSVNNGQYPLGIDNYLSTKPGIQSHSNQYSATFHYCFIRGKSIKITLTSLGSGKLRFAFTGTGGTGSFEYNLKSVPSVADTSLYIRDYVIKSKGFFSMLSAIGKKLGLKKGKVAPNPENGNGPSFFAGFFEELVGAVGKASGIPPSNEEVTVILSSFKTIGDQVRSKDAQMLNGDLISLDNFLLDMVTAANICRSVGEIISGSEVVGIKIYESIDNEKQLSGLIETYNGITVQPKHIVDILDTDIIVTKIAKYTKAINDMRAVEEQRRKDVIIAAENAAKTDTIGKIRTMTAQPLGDLITPLLEKTVQPVVAVGRRTVQPQPDDMDIIITTTPTSTTVKQKDFMNVYRRLHFQHFFDEFYTLFLPVDVDLTNMPLQYLYAIEHIAKDYRTYYVDNIEIIDTYTKSNPPIDGFIAILKETRRFKVDDATNLYINKAIKALDAVSMVKELWRNKLVTLFTNDPYKRNEYCVNYIPTFAGGNRNTKYVGGGLSDGFKHDFINLIYIFLWKYKSESDLWATNIKNAIDQQTKIKNVTVRTKYEYITDIINEQDNSMDSETEENKNIPDNEILLWQATEELFGDLRIEIHMHENENDIFNVLGDELVRTGGQAVFDAFIYMISTKVKPVEIDPVEDEHVEAQLVVAEPVNELRMQQIERLIAKLPSSLPPVQPPAQPTAQPPVQPPAQPTVQPPAQPTAQPPVQPTAQPPVQPTAQPPAQPTVLAQPTVPAPIFIFGQQPVPPTKPSTKKRKETPNIFSFDIPDRPRDKWQRLDGQAIEVYGGKRTRKRQHKLKSKKHNKTNQKRKQQKHTRRISYVKNKQTRKKTQNQ